MFPWERDVYFNQYKNKLEEKRNEYDWKRNIWN
jgi:hypothetical protein